MRWLFTHRLILVIYLSGLTLAAFELKIPEEQAGYLDSPEAFLNPEVSIVDVSTALHPERALTLYYRAYQTALCAGALGKTSPECLKRDPVKPGEVRELIERSLATGNRSIEMAMYNYVIVLIQEGAAPERIDAAIRNWRISHPNSTLADPRAAARKPIRQPIQQSTRPSIRQR